jgi:hypothetical protein
MDFRVIGVFVIKCFKNMYQHNNDEEFASCVENNTWRYLKHFEEAVDELMPAAMNMEEDVFDVLHVSLRNVFLWIFDCVHRIKGWGRQEDQATMHQLILTSPKVLPDALK